MPKKTIDKVRINITIDKELNEILDKKQYSKSALIDSLLWKFLALENNKSPISTLQSPLSKKHLARFERATCGLQDNREWRGEIGERGKSVQSSILSVYKTHKNSYFNWLYETKSQKYANNIISTIEELFKNKDINLDNIKLYIERGRKSKKYCTLAIRNFLNFCEEYELLDLDLINKYRSKVKLNIPYNIDSYVPNTKEIQESRELLKKKYPKFVILYDLMIETGCRFTELKQFILNYDENNVEIWDDSIISYRNFYMRENKSSFFLIYTLETHNRLMQEIKDLNHKELNSFQNITSHKKSIISSKYLRKYNFTLMIENNVSLEIANFIQGRISNNVGFNHYLHKKVIAIREYKKILPHLKF